MNIVFLPVFNHINNFVSINKKIFKFAFALLLCTYIIIPIINECCNFIKNTVIPSVIISWTLEKPLKFGGILKLYYNFVFIIAYFCTKTILLQYIKDNNMIINFNAPLFKCVYILSTTYTHLVTFALILNRTVLTHYLCQVQNYTVLYKLQSN